MKLSELDLATVKSYLRVDGVEDDMLITAIISAGTQYAVTYTGLSAEELDTYADVPLAVLCLIADMYELRQFTVDKAELNPTALQILASHSCNLL